MKMCIRDSIKRANYSELFPSEEEAADRWFKCKLVFITLDGSFLFAGEQFAIVGTFDVRYGDVYKRQSKQSTLTLEHLPLKENINVP